MSILVNKNSKIVVQGLTGREGMFHAEQMIKYGTQVVAGCTPGKGGQTVLGVPIFDTVAQAVEATGADTSIIFVPAAFAGDAVCEAADAGCKLTVCITEHVPVKDMLRAKKFATERGTKIVGPNCPGVITPEECKLGIMPGHIHKKGPVGLISRSGTLTYEVAHQLTQAGLGQSTAIGIGGDPVIGLDFIALLELFRDDPETEAVVTIGEIGGDAEERAAAVVKAGYPKPVFGFIAGLTAPPGKRMGHAGAIVSGGKGKGSDKIAAMEDAGITVIRELGQFGKVVAQKLG